MSLLSGEALWSRKTEHSPGYVIVILHGAPRKDFTGLNAVVVWNTLPSLDAWKDTCMEVLLSKTRQF